MFLLLSGLRDAALTFVVHQFMNPWDLPLLFVAGLHHIYTHYRR